MLKREITVEDALNTRIISWPFGLYDCAAQSDGAAAAVITRADLAKSFRDDYVLVRAVAIARERGSEELQINVDEGDTDACRFYEAHGFSNTEPGQTERLLFYFRRL
jgi:acetyl-CoA C-acetyltransferase